MKKLILLLCVALIGCSQKEPRQTPKDWPYAWKDVSVRDGLPQFDYYRKQDGKIMVDIWEDHHGDWHIGCCTPTTSNSSYMTAEDAEIAVEEDILNGVKK